MIHIEGAYRADVQFLRLVALLGKGVGEGHGETAGMGRGYELLGAGLAVGTLRSRGPRDRETLRSLAADQVEGARSLEQVAVPYHVRTPFRNGHSYLLYIRFLRYLGSLPVHPMV